MGFVFLIMQRVEPLENLPAGSVQPLKIWGISALFLFQFLFYKTPPCRYCSVYFSSCSLDASNSCVSQVRPPPALFCNLLKLGLSELSPEDAVQEKFDF